MGTIVTDQLASTSTARDPVDPLGVFKSTHFSFEPSRPSLTPTRKLQTRTQNGFGGNRVTEHLGDYLMLTEFLCQQTKLVTMRYGPGDLPLGI